MKLRASTVVLDEVAMATILSHRHGLRKMRQMASREAYFAAIALLIASTVSFVRSSTIFFAISSVLLIGSRLTPLIVARLALVRSSIRIVFGSWSAISASMPNSSWI